MSRRPEATPDRVRVRVGVRVGSAPVSWGVRFPDAPRQVPWKRFLDEDVSQVAAPTRMMGAQYLASSAHRGADTQVPAALRDLTG